MNSKIPEISTEKQIKELQSWMDTLDFIGKSPRGMKLQKQSLIELSKLFKTREDYGLPYEFNSYNIINFYIDTLDVDLINLKFGSISNNEPSVVTAKYATYIKSDSRKYSTFTDAINDIELFLKSLNGIHTKALNGLNIKFVSSNKLKSIASYNSTEDLILINISKVGKTSEEYGSLRYIILHELGHRYLKSNRQNWDIDNSKWSTTKYSKIDSFSGEERFAELYAISHWKSKYNEFDSIINEYLTVIT